jgi:hypothetical protein
MGHPFDLHSHTRCSDGILSPKDLVTRAAAQGVASLAVTDHDTLAGLAEAQAAGPACGVRVIPGIELSVSHAGKDFHVLGLFVDPAHAALLALLESRKADRVSRVREILAKLARLGIAIPFDDVAALADTKGTVGRPHVARALVAHGFAGSMDEAFARYLGKRAAAYVPYPRLAAADGIAAIHAAGGVASLAHPGLDDGDAALESFAAAGLDAVEVHHPAHSAGDCAHFQKRAAALALLVSGGSDFHGTGENHELTLGEPGCPADAFAALERKAASHRTRAGAR